MSAWGGRWGNRWGGRWGSVVVEEPPVIEPAPGQVPKVTYTGLAPRVTASKSSPYLVGTVFRKTHNN